MVTKYQKRISLSARAHHRILKLARTIADLAGVSKSSLCIWVGATVVRFRIDTDSKIRSNRCMLRGASYTKAIETILEDAIQRDLTTARRATLLEILWHERYLTRAQLMTRVGLQLGKDCFGVSAWEDTFYRDMHLVKQAFKAAGYTLLYRRNKPQTGYYLEGQPALSPELQQILRSSAAEVDPRQIEIYQQLTPADRFRQGCSISDTARNVVAFRIRQENPGLSPAEANCIALQRAYRP